jgi:hypothetical protein
VNKVLVIKIKVGFSFDSPMQAEIGSAEEQPVKE